MIEIGEIVKPQGIRGEVKIIPQRSAENYSNLRHIFVGESLMDVETISCRDALYVKFVGVDSRNDAENLRGKMCYAKKEELNELSENEFYFEDLIGLPLVDENNNEIGVVEDIDQFGAADVIWIRERNVLFSVPFLDSIFKSVESDRVVVYRREYDEMKISGWFRFFYLK